MNRRQSTPAALMVLLAALLTGWVLPTKADVPFRQHRYDALSVLPADDDDILFIGNSIKLLRFHISMVLDNVRSYREVRLAIHSWLEVFKSSNLQDLAFDRHFKCRIDADSVESEHLLCIHASHACANDNIRLLILAQLF